MSYSFYVASTLLGWFYHIMTSLGQTVYNDLYLFGLFSQLSVYITLEYFLHFELRRATFAKSLEKKYFNKRKVNCSFADCYKNKFFVECI